MVTKRIVSWSVTMILIGVAAVPVAWAEQPIIIPVILVVSKVAGQVDSMGRPKVQTALYKVEDLGKPSHATLLSLSENIGRERVVRNGDRQAANGLHHGDFGTLKRVRLNASGSTEISLPVVLKVVINGEAAAGVSICYSSDTPREHGTKPQGPVISAVDLLTGRPTTVGHDYIEEYQQIVKSLNR